MLEQRILNLLKTDKIPRNTHEIARALQLDELSVMRELNRMSEKVTIALRPLSSTCACSVYYTIR